MVYILTICGQFQFLCSQIDQYIFVSFLILYRVEIFDHLLEDEIDTKTHMVWPFALWFLQSMVLWSYLNYVVLYVLNIESVSLCIISMRYCCHRTCLFKIWCIMCISLYKIISGSNIIPWWLFLEYYPGTPVFTEPECCLGEISKVLLIVFNAERWQH